MKPPAAHPRTRLWTMGAVYGTIGIFLAAADHPMVPLSYVLHIPAIAIGGAVGVAILRERYGPRWIAAYYVVAIWTIYETITNLTSIAALVLFSAAYSLTRAAISWVDENGL